MVKLHDKHTLADHFEAIGEDLTQTAQYFHYLETINTYTVKIPHEVLHNRIRIDPGILRVSHDRYFVADHAKELTTVESKPRGRLSRLFRRWNLKEGMDPYFLGMLSWGSKLDEEPLDGLAPHVCVLGYLGFKIYQLMFRSRNI